MNNSFRFLSVLTLRSYRICFRKKLSIIRTISFNGKFSFESLFREFFIPDKIALLNEQKEFFDPDNHSDRYNEPPFSKIPTISELVTAINRLNKYNNLIIKMYMAGISMKEISDKLNLPEDLVKRRIATDLEILRIFLNR